MKHILNDGGRALAGFKGHNANDCVCRAISIGAELPYKEVYTFLNFTASQSVARTGVSRKVYEEVLRSLGFAWVPTMRVGHGMGAKCIYERGNFLTGGSLRVLADT